PDAGAWRGVEPVLQSRSGDRGSLAAPEADCRIVAGPGAVALFLARTRADGAVRLVCLALGYRAIQARRSVVPRSRATRNWLVAPPPIPRQGAVAQHGSSIGMLLVNRSPLLGLARRWRPAGVPGPQRHRAPGLRGHADSAHGLAHDDAAGAIPGLA